MKNSPLAILMITGLLFTANSAFAHSPTYEYEGMFAGSMICEAGEIGVLFHIQENGTVTLKKFNAHNEPCRSGIGPCNDARDRKFNGTRFVKGTLDFFPTAANPKAPKTRFKITGTGTRQESEMQSKMAVLDRRFNYNYLEISTIVTEGFPENLSGLRFRITIDNPRAKPPYNHMFSHVDGHQCHNLTLTRMKEPKKL